MGNHDLRTRTAGLSSDLGGVTAQLKKNLIIIGAGPLGREIRDLAAGIESVLKDACPWHLTGFLDDRNVSNEGIPILGAPQTYQPKDTDIFVCALGDPAHRAKYASMLRDRGGQFAVLVDGSSKVGGGTLLSSGCLVGPFCSVSCNVATGEDTVLTSHVTVGHDVHLGKCCHLGSHVFLGGGVIAGDKVTFHPHSSVLPGGRIGDGATIGAGAVVLRSVPPGTTVFGVPAMPV